MAKKLNIGIVCYPQFGGSGIVATELGNELCELGHNVHFICYDHPPRFNMGSCSCKMKIHLVNVLSYPLFKFPPYTMALASKIYEVVMKYGLDIVHSHYAIPHTTSAYLAKQMLKNPNFRTITTFHGTDVRLVGLDESYRAITKFSIEQSDGLTAVSQYLADVTIKEFDIKNEIKVIHNFINSHKINSDKEPVSRKELSIPDDERILIHISNFREIKGIPDAIEIFSMINQKVPAHFILIGDGPEMGKAKEMVTKLGLENRVHFLGFRTNIYSYLTISDLLLCTSEMESFGLAVLEAMACGVPVMSYNVGGLTEVIEDGSCGYLIDYGNKQEFAKKAVDIFLDKELKTKFSENGIKIAHSKFPSKKLIKEYEDYYYQVIYSCNLNLHKQS
jgi:L-malate glycosyltransferase